MKRLIFGCGYLGSRVAQRWRERGDDVFAVTRQARRAEELEQAGLRPIVADVTDSATLLSLPQVDSVLYAVGYDRGAAESIEAVYAGGLRNVLAAMPHEVQAFIYASTTGVYGDANGAWVDETTPPAPEREGGHAALAAEDILRESHLASRSVILRLAGLYGPGRVPFLEKLRAGEPIPAAANGWLNLIHVQDAAAVVVAADCKLVRRFSGGPRVFNVADGRPAQRGDYYREVARLVGAPAPRFEPPDPASHRARRASANRRISGAAMLKELEFDLAYPSFREGLRSILTSGAAVNHAPPA